MTEYVALAQIYPALREEMRTTGESFRRSQIDAMERVYADRGLDRSRIGLPGLMLLMSPLARSFVIEREARVTLAHAEVEDLIMRLLDRFDPLGEVDAAPEPLQQRS